MPSRRKLLLGGGAALTGLCSPTSTNPESRVMPAREKWDDAPLPWHQDRNRTARPERAARMIRLTV